MISGLLILLGYLIGSGILAWTVGAIYYDVGRDRWFAWPLTLFGIAIVGAAYLAWGPSWQLLTGLIVAFILFLAWWLSLKPSNERNWDPNYSKLPKFVADGNSVLVDNVRNTSYRSGSDFTPYYETREYDVSNLRGVDVAITYWGSPLLCHPMLIFDFENDGRLCISIEVRYRVGQKYNFIRSLYRQQEIIYVASDERDAILKRSKHSENHDVYLYQLVAEREEVIKLFFEYVVSANRLLDSPRWYHGLSANCTTSIYRQRAQKVEWDWRWLFNGKLDAMLYEHGRINTAVSFAELKRKSKINELASHAPTDETFGDFIRDNLPGERTADVSSSALA